MSRIKILPETLSNKIAAGEVVERPSSVVKELVENAVDAESTRIVIDIEQGGRSLIRVSDNGLGMNHDDALLALERHGTSKIFTDEDLYAIRTLGFRGEALPSIASVSQFEMITRSRESDSGVRIEVSGGRILNVSESGAPPGTMITVRRLFFNTPARRKFLKTDATEMSHVADSLSAIALAWPSVCFRLVHEGRVLRHWDASGDAADRAFDVLGHDLKGQLIRLESVSGQVTVRGWIASPDETRGNAQKLFLFVNNRTIRDRGILQAIFEGYRERLMKGRFPMGVLFIQVPFDRVDVNVHPTKHEVRFADYRQVHDAVRSAVAGALERGRTPSRFAPRRNGHGSLSPVAGPAHASTPSQRSQTETSFPARDRGSPEAYPLGPDPSQPPVAQTGVAECATSFAPNPSTGKPSPSSAGKSIEPDAPETVPRTGAQRLLWKGDRFSDLNIIGQFRTTYILCESGEDLVLIDQHAAHERIVYEQIKRRMASGHPGSQRLLVPETIELGYRETEILNRLLPDFAGMGLEIEPFGGNTFVIKSIPLPLADRSAAPLVLEMVDAIVDTGSSQAMGNTLDACIRIMACHGSIRANQRLTREEMAALLKQLDGCENPRHCPHGRPTSIRWSLTSVEKAFKRIV